MPKNSIGYVEVVFCLRVPNREVVYVAVKQRSPQQVIVTSSQHAPVRLNSIAPPRTRTVKTVIYVSIGSTVWEVHGPKTARWPVSREDEAIELDQLLRTTRHRCHHPMGQVVCSNTLAFLAELKVRTAPEARPPLLSLRKHWGRLVSLVRHLLKPLVNARRLGRMQGHIYVRVFLM